MSIRLPEHQRGGDKTQPSAGLLLRPARPPRPSSSTCPSNVLITACRLTFRRAARSSISRNIPGVKSTLTLCTGRTKVNLLVNQADTSSPRDAIPASSAAVGVLLDVFGIALSTESLLLHVVEELFVHDLPVHDLVNGDLLHREPSAFGLKSNVQFESHREVRPRNQRTFDGDRVDFVISRPPF